MTADTELRDLVGRLDLIRGLQQHPGWQVLAGIVSDQIVKKNRAILSPAPATIEDVRWNAGWIVGAQAVLDLREELERQVERRTMRIEEERAAA